MLALALGSFARLTLCVTAVCGATVLARPVLHIEGAAGSARFVENLGQWPADVRFAASIGGVVARAECGGLGFHAVEPDGRATYVRLVFEGGAARPEPQGVELLPGVHHYYLGNDPGRWRTNARAYAAVRYADLYTGVDLVLRAEGPSAKYDLILAPGVDPAVVRARWIGADDAQAAGRGVALRIGSAAIHELPVVAWQTRADGARIDADVRWTVDAGGALRLVTQGLDPALPLVVDPEIVWGTYLAGGYVPGSPTEGTRLVRAGSEGSTFVAGKTFLQSFPVTPGAYRHTPPNGHYITVARLRGDGSAVYVAALGGSEILWETSGVSDVDALSSDSQGRVLVAGYTRSVDFPTTKLAFDRTLHQAGAAYVLRLSADGANLELSTLLDGDVAEGYSIHARGCHAYEDGRVLLGGSFPGTTPAFLSTYPPIGTPPTPTSAFPVVSVGFVTCFDATGSTILWSRILGDRAGVSQLAVASNGKIHLSGSVRGPGFPTTPGAFMTAKPHPTNQILYALQLSNDGSQLHWSTFLGTAESSEVTWAYDLSLDDFGVLALSFLTNVRTFPTTADSLLPTPPPLPGSFSGGGILRLAPDGGHLVASTYTSAGYGSLGAPHVDRSGLVTAVGQPGSTFPATPGAADETLGPGSEVQIGRFDPRLRRLLHLRHFGGPVPKFITTASVHPDRSVTVGGSVQAPGLMPTTPGAFQPNWPGAGVGGFAITLNLTVDGVEPLASGTQACRGSIVTEAWRNPVAGAADFGLYVSGAPENARGVLFIGRPAPAPAAFGGALLHVDRTAGLRALRVRSDEFGYLEAELPVPALPPGTEFTVQFLFQNPPQCAAGTAFSSSNALRLTVR
ncbi:MAG: hypothetical protein JNK02_18090 [Planctomycetes bacterium]|nr:hypothetical protein [Planctomycetota bacterium]